MCTLLGNLPFQRLEVSCSKVDLRKNLRLRMSETRCTFKSEKAQLGKVARLPCRCVDVLKWLLFPSRAG